MPPRCITVHKRKKKILYQQKLLISLLLLPIHLAASLNNNIAIEGMVIQHGNLSPFGQILQEQLQNKETNSDIKFQLIYINTDSSLTEQQILEIRQLLHTSHVIILDGTTSSSETIQTTSAAIGGIGLSSPVIMIRASKKAFPEYKQIIIPVTNNEPTPEILTRLADESYQLLVTWRPTHYQVRSAGLTKSRWRPEASLSIEQRHINLSCMVGSKFESRQGNEPGWTEGMIDACNHSASLSLSYTIDLIRSVPSYLADTQDFKYLRITVDPETSGGAGWHLVKAPTHKHTWFESWTNRETWFGPIADHYQVAIHSLDPDVHLYNAIPANQPRDSQITHRSSLQIGVMGQVIFQHPALAAHDQERIDDEDIPAEDYESDHGSASTSDTDSFHTAEEADIALLEDVESDHEDGQSTASSLYGSITNDIARLEDVENDTQVHALNDTTIEGATAIPSHDEGYSPQVGQVGVNQGTSDSAYAAPLAHEAEPDPPNPLYAKKIFDGWGKIINNSDLTEPEKQSLFSRIMIEVYQDSRNPNENAIRREYWFLGLRKDRYPEILQAFAQNPPGFLFDSSSRPSFSSATQTPEPSTSQTSAESYPPPVPVIAMTNEERSEYHHDLLQNYPTPGKQEISLTDRIFKTWQKLINDTDVLNESQKTDLFKYILLQLYMGTGNQLAAISRREYWLIGLSPQYSAAIMRAFAEDPEGFKYGNKAPVLPATSKHYKGRHYRSQADLISAFTYSSIRSIQYNNYEYAVINQSKAGRTDQAKWLWTRNYQHTSPHWRNHVTCPLWCQDWFFKDSYFSPAAYAHFTPGFSATFMVQASKENTSSFIFSTTVKPVALGGRVSYRFFLQEYSHWGQSGDSQTINQLLTVKWGSPVFHPEAPATLKIRHQNRCLNVRENSYHSGVQVNLYKCRNLKSQLWGHDDNFRLKPHSAPEQCLTRTNENVLLLHSCGHAENQKWYWKHDRLMNSHGCYLSMTENNKLGINCDKTETSRWSLQVLPPDSLDTLLMGPL